MPPPDHSGGGGEPGWRLCQEVARGQTPLKAGAISRKAACVMARNGSARLFLWVCVANGRPRVLEWLMRSHDQSGGCPQAPPPPSGWLSCRRRHLWSVNLFVFAQLDGKRSVPGPPGQACPPPPRPGRPCRGTEGTAPTVQQSSAALDSASDDGWLLSSSVPACPLMSPVLCSRPLVLRPTSAGVTGGGAPVHAQTAPVQRRFGRSKRTCRPRRDEEDERKDGFAGAELPSAKRPASL